MEIKNILLVDDSETDQFLTKLFLEEHYPHSTIHQVYDGQEALDFLNQQTDSPDLIILDINMPGMDGLEFLAEYEKQPPNATTIAMLTSSNQKKDIDAVMKYDFVKFYFTKLLDQDDINALNNL